MLEHLQALTLTLLEMIFIFVSLALLHSQRRAIGKAPFYMAAGMLLLFAHLVVAADCRALLAGTFDFPIGRVVIFLPVLASLLMVYITEGTLATQRMIIGSVVLYGLFLYVGEITRLQCNWLGFAIGSGVSGPTLDQLLRETRDSMNLVALTHLLDFFAVPIVYTRLQAFRIGRFFSILGALLSAHLVGILLQLSFGNLFGTHEPIWSGLSIARVIATVILSLLLWGYLSKIEVDNRTGERSALDLLFAFIGSYGRSKELEANLREWTDRYQLVLENAGELIIMLSPGGKIIDANIAAGTLLGVSDPQQLTGRPLFPRLRIMMPSPFVPGEVPEHPVRFKAIVDEHSTRPVTLSCSLSSIQMRGQTLLVMIGRDITEETRLAEEKARLSEQLAHSQRIESLGMLAGGIAHDFNNYIHAILGHVDVITMLHTPDDPEVMNHLEKVTKIAEQAGNLTNQLLGFARKGKYQVAEQNLRSIIESSLSLLGPKKRQNLEISFRTGPGLPTVMADQLQLQQVMLNLMLNAIDAMADNDGERLLTIYAASAIEAPIPLEPPPDKAVKPEDYVFVLIGDNGSGMSEETKRRLFEPFYTTKPVGLGTGMGLAMVYGTITNHNGWLQVVSSPGQGSQFYLFLPRANHSRPRSAPAIPEH